MIYSVTWAAECPSCGAMISMTATECPQYPTTEPSDETSLVCQCGCPVVLRFVGLSVNPWQTELPEDEDDFEDLDEEEHAVVLRELDSLLDEAHPDPTLGALSDGMFAALRAAPPEVVAAALGWEQVGGPTDSTGGPAWSFPPHVSGEQPAFRPPPTE